MTPKNAAILARIAFIQGTSKTASATLDALRCHQITDDPLDELHEAQLIKGTIDPDGFALTPAGWQLITNALIDVALEGGAS